jgi:hypothetical protein
MSGRPDPETPSAPSAKSAADTAGTVSNSLTYRGGTVVQGNLTIRDTVIDLVDLDTTDPLRLAVDAIGVQIAAGYVKLGVDGDMTTFIPDADQVAGPGAAPAVTPTSKARARSM